MIKSRYAILGLLTALNLVNYIDRFLVMAVGPKFQAELGLGDSELGIVETAFMIGYMLTSPIFGRLGDKRPRKGLIAAGVAIWSVATVVSGMTHGIGTMVAARIAVGVGEASYATLSPTIIVDMAPEQSKNKWLAIFYSATPVGAALGYVLGGVLEPRFGWRSAFFIAGGPGVALALIALLIAEPARKLVEAAGEKVRGVYGELFRNRQYRYAVLGYVAQTFALGGFTAWAAPFLARKLCFPLATGNQIFGYITVVTGLVGTAAGGFVADRIPGEDRTRVNLRICAWSSALAAPFAFAAVTFSSSTAFLIALGLAELAIFASMSSTNAAVLLSVPERLRANAMAMSIFAIHLLGDLISPPLIGAVSDAAHDSHDFCSGGRGLQNGLYLLPVALGLSAVAWFIGSTQRRGPTEPVTPPGTA